MNYRVSLLANRDLDCIWEYIASDNPIAANRVDEELHAAMKLLAEFPGMGHTRADVSDPRYLFWPVYSYVIAYRIEAEALLVVRVIHGARNIRQVLGRQHRD